MIYAQILDGVVQNTIVLTDPTLESIFAAGFDYFIEIDGLTPMPSIGWSYNGTSFTAPVPPILTTTQIYTQVVIAAMAFGNQLAIQYSVQNILAGITASGKTQALIDYTNNLSQCLYTGSLYAAIGAIEVMIADTSDTKTSLAPFVTNDILYTYLNQIQTYLGLALTANPGP